MARREVDEVLRIKPLLLLDEQRAQAQRPAAERSVGDVIPTCPGQEEFVAGDRGAAVLVARFAD